MYITVLERSEALYDSYKKAYDSAKKEYERSQSRYWYDIMVNAKSTLDGYDRFGYEGIDYHLDEEDNPLYPYLYSMRDKFAIRFRNKYGRYRIAISTNTQFNAELQTIFDDIADEYEAKFTIKQTVESWVRSGDYRTHMRSKFDNWGTNKARQKDLPDIVEGENIAHAETSGDHHEGGSHETFDESIITQLNTLVALATVRRRVAQDYLNEFAKLFQTVTT